MDNFSMNSSPMEPHIEGNNPASTETENSDVNIIDDDNAYSCRVCSDRATGNHYNVYTCEGCKGFFKRTVQKQLVYHCRGIGAQGMCVVTKASRNNCQFCRFNKCLAVGMLIDAVREDRAPGGKPRQKKPRLSSDGESMSSTSTTTASESSKQTTQSSPMVVKTEVVKDDASEMQAVIQGLLDAKPDLRPGPSINVPGPPLPGDMPPGGGPPPFPGCAPLSESPMPMGAGLPGHPPGGAGVPNPQDITSMEMMKYGYQELRMIIQWAKKVPGFKSINMQDQMALLKSCFLDLSVLRVAYRSLDLVGMNKIRYADGLVMSVDEVVTLGWSMDLITCTVEYINQVHSLQLDNVEFAALSALVLTYPDAKGIIDKQNVSDLQSKILECLRYHICTVYPTQTKRYTKILLRLPILREVSAKAKSSFLRMNMDGILQMDQLAGEMLDYDEQR